MNQLSQILVFAETTLNPKTCHDHNESSPRKRTCKGHNESTQHKNTSIDMTTWKCHRAVDALVHLSTFFQHMLILTRFDLNQPRGWQTQSTDKNVSRYFSIGGIEVCSCQLLGILHQQTSGWKQTTPDFIVSRKEPHPKACKNSTKGTCQETIKSRVNSFPI